MPDKQVPPEISEYFRRLGKKNGSAGGKAAADNMTEAERKKRARDAGLASAVARAAKRAEREKAGAKKATKKKV